MHTFTQFGIAQQNHNLIFRVSMLNTHRYRHRYKEALLQQGFTNFSQDSDGVC